MSQIIPSTTPIRTFEDHEGHIIADVVFPDKRRMITGSYDKTLRLWDLETGVVLKKMEGYRGWVLALAVSRDGQIIASGDTTGEVFAWHGETGESIVQSIKAHSYQITSVDFSPDGTKERVAYLTTTTSWNMSLAWTPDGTRLLSGGYKTKDNILEWDTSTWQQVGHPWEGHTDYINAIAIHPTGTLVASASRDRYIRLWRLLDQRTIAIFQHSSILRCVTFSVDGKYILSGGEDNKISEWAILDITTACDACLTGDLSIAEDLLTQEIHTKADDFTSYANRSVVMARQHNLDHALEDAIKSVNIRPSLMGFISKGIALCGKGHIREARVAFDVASMFTNQDSETNQFLLLIKAIALFNADQHEEAMLLIEDLAAACPNVDPLPRRVVETYLRVQLGIKAFDGAHHDEAADHFTAAVNSDAFSLKYIHLVYPDLTVLFGWDLESLLLTTHQKRCQAFLSAGKLDEALEAHKYMMDAIDDIAKASCLDWSNQFKEKCSTLAADIDRILGAEIPGQEQDGYDAEPNFFQGMHQHSQISRPRLQQRSGRLKRLKLALMRRLQEAPAPVPPTTSPPVAVTTTIKTHLRHLFTRSPHHATTPVVDVPFAKAKERNAAAGAPGKDPDIVPDEYLDAVEPDPDTQQQQQPHQQAVAVHIDPGEHGGGKSCVCC
ncbi:WD40 repeat-like protein [Suillus hirtellus]|nr:WD40 repeat-like protein [Suillus hirtellus]